MPLHPPRAAHRARLRLLVAAPAVTALVAACDQPQAYIAGPESAPVALASYVTPEAAAALGADGRFAVSALSEPAPRPIISAERAGELALAYARSFGPSLKPAWEKERGAALDLGGLRVVSRIMYAATPYGAFPTGYHPAFERALGPYYLVPLGHGTEPELMVTVSAYATEVTLDSRGLLHRPVKRGMEFASRAIPTDTSTYRLLAPEQAVEMVGRVTQARIARAPELVRLGMPQHPASSAWKLTLDRDVLVQNRSGAQSRVRELYVGVEPRNRVMAPVPGGPRTEPVPAVRLNAVEGQRHDILQLPIRTGKAVSFQPVTVQQGEQ